jgi:hypothetical protein
MKRFLTLFLVVIFLAAMIPMGGIVFANGSVTLDGTVSSDTDDDTSTFSMSHTTGTGANRLMLVGVSWNSANSARNITSVTFTYGSGTPTVLPLSEVITQQPSESVYRYAAIYSLVAPPTGETGTVTINFSNSVNYGIVAGVANFAGVDQTTPLGPSDGDGETSDNHPIVTLTGLDGNELVFDTLFIGGSGEIQDPSVGAGQTKQWTAYQANARGAGSTEQASGSSVTMDWTLTTSTYWVLAAVAINPVAGPTYNLTMAVDPVSSGTTDPSVGVHPYGEGTVVPIEATATPGYLFDHWSGDLSGSDNPTSITMTGDKGVTAHFTEFTPVTLDGSVSSDSADDVSTIEFSHTTGTGTGRLMLVGVSWNSGDNDRSISSVIFSYGSGPTELPLSEVIKRKNADRYRYSAIYYYLAPPSGEMGTVTVTFSDSVSNGIVAGAANFAGVDQTTPLDLGAADGADGNSDTPSVSLTGLNGDELVFDNVFQGATNDSQELDAGSGQTRQWHEFAGNTRGAASTEQATGSSVTMSWTATAESSYWVMVAVPINPGPAVMYDLTVSTVGNGSVTLDPPGGTYEEGTEVELTAVADYGSYFSGWSGALTGNTNPETITMDDNKSVTATFAVGPTVTRILPGGDLYPDDVFDVTVQFTTHVNDFNAIGFTDIAPAGWAVSVDKTWCTPAADVAGTPETNEAIYAWISTHTSGTVFTIVYKVTVPTGATPGTYTFPDGEIEYYIGTDVISYFAGITGDDTVNVGAIPLENTWYLHNDGTMYREEIPSPEDTEPIADNTIVLWLSNETALGNYTFPGGEWSGKITIQETLVSGDEFSVTIGSYSGSFTGAVNGTVDFEGDGSTQVFDISKTVNAFTVPQDGYLAIQIENKSGGSTNPFNVKTGSIHSYVTCPETEPDFPLPEWASGLLMGLGLAALGTIIWIQRRKRHIRKYT